LVVTQRNPPADVVGRPAHGVHLPTPVQLVKKSHAVTDGFVHVSGKQGAEAGFFRADPIPVRIFADEGLRGSVVGKNGEIVMAGISAKKRQDGVVALLPVGAVHLVVGVDLDAVVESVAVPGKGVNQELGALLPDNPEPAGDDPEKEILQMDGAVAEVEGDLGKGAQGHFSFRWRFHLSSHSAKGRWCRK